MMRQLLRQHAGNVRPANPGTPSLDQPDTLDVGEVELQPAGHSGIPEATDSFAYDTVQRLLAVGAPA